MNDDDRAIAEALGWRGWRELGAKCAELEQQLAYALGTLDSYQKVEAERDAALAEVARLRSGEPTEYALHHENSDLRTEVARLREYLCDIARNAGRDVPDATDNDGTPYQSEGLDTVLRAALGDG